MAAAQMGLTAALSKLIEYGCDIGQVDNNQHDTLCYALVETTEHHLECLRTCLDQEENYYKNTMSILLAIEKGEGNGLNIQWRGNFPRGRRDFSSFSLLYSKV